MNIKFKYTANAIQDLCETRDLHYFERFYNTEIEHLFNICVK